MEEQYVGHPLEPLAQPNLSLPLPKPKLIPGFPHALVHVFLVLRLFHSPSERLPRPQTQCLGRHLTVDHVLTSPASLYLQILSSIFKFCPPVPLLWLLQLPHPPKLKVPHFCKEAHKILQEVLLLVSLLERLCFQSRPSNAMSASSTSSDVMWVCQSVLIRLTGLVNSKDVPLKRRKESWFSTFPTKSMRSRFALPSSFTCGTPPKKKTVHHTYM